MELQLTTGDAPALLRQRLPLYEGVQDADDGFETMSSPVTRETKSKLEVFDGVPLSNEECLRGWIEICAFEDDLRRATRPSANALIGIWTTILGAAVSEGISLASAFQVDELWRLIEDDGYPRPLLEAVVRRLISDEYIADDGCKFILSVAVNAVTDFLQGLASTKSNAWPGSVLPYLNRSVVQAICRCQSSYPTGRTICRKTGENQSPLM